MNAQPNLFFIGTAKSGTSTITSFLRQHSEIMVSEPKETCFHILKYVHGMDYYINNYFKEYNGQQIICDASVLNLYFHEITAKRIYKDFPNAKILVVLRDPITRAYSDYRQSVIRGLETTSFEKSFYKEKQRLKNDYWPLHERQYFRRGMYFEQLNQYYKYFDKDQIKILLYEDFFCDLNNGLKELFKFLGIKNQKIINLEVKKNENKNTVKSLYLQRFLRGDLRHFSLIKNFIPKKYKNYIIPIRNKIMNNNIKSNGIRNTNQNFLNTLRHYYKDNNYNLNKIYKLNIEKWI